MVNSTKSAQISRLFLSDEENLKLGQIINDALVSMHTYKGIYVKFKGSNNKQVVGFIPKRHLFEKFNSKHQESEKEDEENDENENENDQEKTDEDKKSKKTKKNDAKNMTKEDLEAAFPLNSKIKARIYDFSLIEDVILLSHRTSVLQATYMLYSELQIGQVVKCKVRCINPTNGGLNVYLSDFLSGFVPKIHTGDVPLSDAMLARKMKRGTELKCRIIQLDEEEKRCVLTAKKTLVKSKLPLIDSFENIKLGMDTYGTVVSIQSYGLLLSFLNGLKGLLPRQQLSTLQDVRDEKTDLKKLYHIGQLLKCKIFKYDSQRQQLKLSLIMKQQDTDPQSGRIINYLL